MDAENTSKIVLGCLFIIGIAVVGIIAPQFYWSLSAWRYRNAEAMEPTEAQYSLHRLRYAALLTIFVPPLIGVSWPGEGETKFSAWVVSALAAVGIMVAVIVIRAVIRVRSQRSTIDHERPSELSSEGYAAEWLGIGYTLFYTLLIVGIAVGVQSSIAQQREERDSAPSRLSDEELQQYIDRLTSIMPTYTPPTEIDRGALAVYAAVPEGLYAASPVRTAINDIGVFRAGGYTTPCPLVGMLVAESSVNVSIGLLYDPAPAIAAGADPAAFCVRDTTNTIEFTSTPLVIGERVLLALDGSKRIVGTY